MLPYLIRHARLSNVVCNMFDVNRILATPRPTRPTTTPTTTTTRRTTTTTTPRPTTTRRRITYRPLEGTLLDSSVVLFKLLLNMRCACLYYFVISHIICDHLSFNLFFHRCYVKCDIYINCIYCVGNIWFNGITVLCITSLSESIIHSLNQSTCTCFVFT